MQGHVSLLGTHNLYQNWKIQMSNHNQTSNLPKKLTLRQLYVNPSAYSLANKLFNNNKVSSKWGSFGKLNAQILNKWQDLHTNLWLNLNATTAKFNVNVNISMAHQQYFINSHFFFNVLHFGLNEGNTLILLAGSTQVDKLKIGRNEF